jgi:hypothetical protein
MRNGASRSESKPGREVPTMPIEGYLVNPPHREDWPCMIGGLVINFGAIETLTYEWIRRLSPDPSHLETVLKKPFRTRVEKLRDLINESDLPEDLKSEASGAWDAARGLAEFRNKIAHSPIILGWRGRSEGDPDYIGVLDYRSAAANQWQLREDINRDQVARKIDEAVQIYSRLQGILERLPSGTVPGTGGNPEVDPDAAG